MAYICSKILKGLQYIHAQNRIHGDIRSDSIYLTENGGVKLLDFGYGFSSPVTKYREDLGVNIKKKIEFRINHFTGGLLEIARIYTSRIL